MEKEEPNDWFEDIETIVSNSLRFKAKLAIGEDAYASLRFKKKASETWDALASASVGTAGGTAVSVICAPNAFLAMLGFATPIGWVIAAGVLTGGAWYGVSRYLKGNTSNRTTVIPEFINTPMDVLALALFDLLAALALKVSHIDGHVHESERNLIKNYFVKEWGYDKKFVTEGILFIEPRLSEFSIKVLAKTLAEFKKENQDCNYESMSKEIITFLQNIIESDGRSHECEVRAIENVKAIFEETGKFSFKKVAESGWGSTKGTVKKIIPKNFVPWKKS